MEDVKLVGKINGLIIKKPIIIAEKIDVIGNVELTTEEIMCFEIVLQLLGIQLLKENVDISKLHSVTIMFVSDGNYSIQLMDKRIAGYTTSVIVYVMNKIRTWSYIERIMAILLEELAHHFWNITDEIIVKHKVLEIMRNLNPDFNMEDIYDNGQKYL